MNNWSHARKQDTKVMDKWSQSGKDTKSPKGIFSTNIYILQVRGCIQQNKIIVSINSSCKHNFINVKVARELQVSVKHIVKTQVDKEEVQIYKDLKISMDEYVLYSDFYTSYMDNVDVDVILGYPWMDQLVL